MLDYAIDLDLSLKDTVVYMVNAANNSVVDPNKTLLIYEGKKNESGEPLCDLKDINTDNVYTFTYTKVSLNDVNNFSLPETVNLINEILTKIYTGDEPLTYLESCKKNIINIFKRECLSSKIKNIIFWEFDDDVNNVYDVKWDETLEKFTFTFPSFTFESNYELNVNLPSYEFIDTYELDGYYKSQYSGDVATEVTRRAFGGITLDGDDLYI